MSVYDGLIGQPVVVGYGNYGLRFGVLDAVDGTTVRLRDSRHIFNFAAQPAAAGAQGVEALQTHGPAAGSRIGPVVALTVVSDVKRVGVCTDAAVAVFAAAGWPR